MSRNPEASDQYQLRVPLPTTPEAFSMPKAALPLAAAAQKSGLDVGGLRRSGPIPCCQRQTSSGFGLRSWRKTVPPGGQLEDLDGLGGRAGA